jgi:hypothetical protein
VLHDGRAGQSKQAHDGRPLSADADDQLDRQTHRLPDAGSRGQDQDQVSGYHENSPFDQKST